MKVRSFDPGRIMMTDALLDELGERFVSGHMRELLQVSFEKYLTDPEYYDELAERMKRGAGLQRRDKCDAWFLVLLDGRRVQLTGMN